MSRILASDLGAARYVQGERSVNTRDLPAYLSRLESGTLATGPSETLEPEARRAKPPCSCCGVRAQGIDRDDFASRTGFTLDDLAGPAITRAVARGWLDDDGRRVRLTREGLFLADSVLCEFL